MKVERREYQRRFAKEIETVDNIIKNQVNSMQQDFQKSKNKLLEAGGKRIRPLLLISAGRFARKGQEKEKEEQLYHLAAALEILHMASLIHDDIIDRAETRRGSASTYNELGLEHAVFLGDFLLSQGYRLLHEHCPKPALLKVDSTLKATCEGEMLEFNNRYNLSLTSRDYLRQIRRKTALIFGLATYLGGYATGIRGQKINLLYKLGVEMGMAFQIQDDLLDFIGVEEELGKPVAQDLKQGVYSLPVICLWEKHAASQQIKKILTDKELSKKELQYLQQEIKKEEITAYVEELCQRFFARAIDLLHQLPSGQAQEDLFFILDYQKNRRC